LPEHLDLLEDELAESFARAVGHLTEVSAIYSDSARSVLQSVELSAAEKCLEGFNQEFLRLQNASWNDQSGCVGKAIETLQEFQGSVRAQIDALGSGQPFHASIANTVLISAVRNEITDDLERVGLLRLALLECDIGQLEVNCIPNED